VLEVDPDNATARRQVGQVVTAVRQFDEATPGRRWFSKVRRRARFRAWLHSVGRGEESGWLGAAAIWVLVIVGALVLGFTLGITTPPRESPQTEEKKSPADEKKLPLPRDEKNRDVQPISN